MKLYLKKFTKEELIQNIYEADAMPIADLPPFVKDVLKKGGCHYAQHTAIIGCDTGTCQHIPGMEANFVDEGNGKPGFQSPDLIYSDADGVEFWECGCAK